MAGQLQAGEDYATLAPVIGIHLLDFTPPGVLVTVDRDGAFFLPPDWGEAILARAAAVVAREEHLHAALANGDSLVDALGFTDAA